MGSIITYKDAQQTKWVSGSVTKVNEVSNKAIVDQTIKRHIENRQGKGDKRMTKK